MRRPLSTRDRLYTPGKYRTASTLHTPDRNRTPLLRRRSSDLRSRSLQWFRGRDFDRRHFDRKDFGRKDFGRKNFGRKDFGRKDFGRKDFGRRPFGRRDFGRFDHKDWDGRFRRRHNDFVFGRRNRCRHGHFGGCNLCDFHHGGWSFSLSWGWPYYSSWCGYGWYRPWYGSYLSFALWPYYTYGSSYYYDDLYYDPGPTHYTDLIGGGVPKVVYEELPPVELPSPADAGAEPAAADHVGSVLAPMLGGGADVGPAFALGEERFRRGEFAGAVAAFEESVLTGTADPSARIALSLALIGAEDYSGAARVLRIGLQELPQVSAVALDVDPLFADRTAWDEAFGRLRAASQQEPANADLALLTGFTLFAVGNLQEASQYLWSAYDRGRRDADLAEVLLAAEARRRAQ